MNVDLDISMENTCLSGTTCASICHTEMDNAAPLA